MHMPQSFLKASCFVTLLWMFSWASPGLAAEARKIKLGSLQTGSQDFVHTVMERQKLLQRYNIPYERIGILNPPALHIMIAEKSVDIGYGGVNAPATARARGEGKHGVFVVFLLLNAV